MKHLLWSVANFSVYHSVSWKLQVIFKFALKQSLLFSYPIFGWWNKQTKSVFHKFPAVVLALHRATKVIEIVHYNNLSKACSPDPQLPVLITHEHLLASPSQAGSYSWNCLNNKQLRLKTQLHIHIFFCSCLFDRRLKQMGIWMFLYTRNNFYESDFLALTTFGLNESSGVNKFLSIPSIDEVFIQIPLPYNINEQNAFVFKKMICRESHLACRLWTHHLYTNYI